MLIQRNTPTDANLHSVSGASIIFEIKKAFIAIFIPELKAKIKLYFKKANISYGTKFIQISTDVSKVSLRY